MMPNPELLGGGRYKCQPKINAQIKEKAEQVEWVAKYQLLKAARELCYPSRIDL